MAMKWLALRGPFTAGSWQALNNRQMATLKRAICNKKWLAMLPFLPFVALTETTNGPFMSCLLGMPDILQTTCGLFGAKPLSEPMLVYCQLDWNKLQWNFNQNTKCFIHETASENICKTAAILSTRRWVNNIPTLAQIMAWRQLGVKLLSQPMVA